MIIQRAAHLGMCFGVRDAITLATRTARTQPLTILGQLVHNETVVGRLRAAGIHIAAGPADIPTRTVMITAHGTADRTRAELQARGLEVLEATCPLVHLAHGAVQRLVQDGYHPVIVGQRNHVEVRGLTGDLDAFDVVLSEADVDQVATRDRFGVVAQTTQPIERVRHLAQALRQRFPGAEVKLVDTVCRPTKDRQAAAVELAETSEVVVVIGGVASNNTRELVATCARHCARVHHVQGPDDLQPDWFHPEDRVGLTAGTSTPDATIDAVEARLREIAVVEHFPFAEQAPMTAGRSALALPLA
ncbi:MAG: 4-hydroxy-3-methylbut-2-enyl diphosphate reductase [Verrucomicrobiales bacterium]|nr:4-hydroxy-3-methylbut-2-enyl diphosphate reductase [Verrucomicrobiales bacterium]